MIDPASWPRFFVGATVSLAGQPYIFVETVVGLAIDEVVGLAIGRAILTKADVTVGFFRLFLW